MHQVRALHGETRRGMRALTAGPEGKERRIATSGAQRTRRNQPRKEMTVVVVPLPLLYSAGRGR